LEHAAGYFLWLADRARKKFDMSSAESRIAGFEALLLPSIRRISDRLERAAVATEVAEYLGVDRSLVLKEFRATPSSSRARGPAAPSKTNGASMSERVLLRSLLTDPEVRETLIVPLGASEVARTWPAWPVIRAVIELADAGDAVTYPAVEARLADEAQKNLLSGAIFADNTSGEVFLAIKRGCM
jgi:DNA primase